MNRRLWLGLGLAAAATGLVWLVAASSGPSEPTIELLNVSYDPTRELWRDLNRAFTDAYRSETGQRVTIKQSHGGSSAQARAVIDGLEADVVTLALWSDTDALRKKGLLADGWEERLPNRSLPYVSTIVFVVRRSNPRRIADWPDLVRPDVQVITPNPKTSGNGKLSFLAAWASVTERGGSEEEARDFVTRLYRNVPVLDTGARGATTTFSQKRIGDVHLTWENEARLEVQESEGELEVVYPPISVRAEPPVAVVDAHVDRKGTREAAEAYLRFLYTPEAQELIAQHFYRPIDEAVLRRHAATFPPITLVPLARLGPDGDAVQQKFFGEGGVFDQVLQARSK